MPRDLPLRRVGGRDRQVRGEPELFGDRQDPFDEPLEVRAGGPDLAARKIYELVGEAVPDRAPEVLLDQPMRERRQRLALVDGAGDPGG